MFAYSWPKSMPQYYNDEPIAIDLFRSKKFEFTILKFSIIRTITVCYRKALFSVYVCKDPFYHHIYKENIWKFIYLNKFHLAAPRGSTRLSTSPPLTSQLDWGKIREAKKQAQRLQAPLTHPPFVCVNRWICMYVWMCAVCVYVCVCVSHFQHK